MFLNPDLTKIMQYGFTPLAAEGFVQYAG